MDLVSHSWAKIQAIRHAGVRETMDLEILGEDHTYVGQGLLQHNSAADLFKTAIVRVSNLLRNAGARTRIVNFVHDEIQFYWHRSELELLPEVKRVMEDFPEFSVPIVADVAYSKRDWANKKEL
jgi:hypothetical protein